MPGGITAGRQQAIQDLMIAAGVSTKLEAGTTITNVLSEK